MVPDLGIYSLTGLCSSDVSAHYYSVNSCVCLTRVPFQRLFDPQQPIEMYLQNHFEHRSPRWTRLDSERLLPSQRITKSR
jgi:hypothetical protein